ncbi:radical SAM family heme chaperone HemW [Flavobacteriales bacterium]|nr:radical SAM family heme chaperone HemW [Flavobacteriales bacterium]
MAGIYIHIPYCKQKCTYCDFHFSTNMKNMRQMIECLYIEIEKRKNYLDGKTIETIYFGGGTPSLLESEKIKYLLEKIRSTYKVSKEAEITLELNPDDITEKKITALKNIGVNRLSIGVQSFHDRDLEFMNRSHNSVQAINAVNIAHNAGIKNITIDLIYGIPGQSMRQWEENLNQLSTLKITHFSAYALTIEPNTKLHHLIKSKKLCQVEDSVIERQFKLLQDISKKMNFIQYEISNFCKKNMMSKHNSSYWEDKWYLGIGPSAHSFNGKERRWNIKSNSKYISSVNNNQVYYEFELLNQKQKYNEYILTCLRTKWGVSFDYLNKNFDVDIQNHFKKEIQKWIKQKKVIRKKNHELTKDGMLLADAISSDLFIT